MILNKLYNKECNNRFVFLIYKVYQLFGTFWKWWMKPLVYIKKKKKFDCLLHSLNLQLKYIHILLASFYGLILYQYLSSAGRVVEWKFMEAEVCKNIFCLNLCINLELLFRYTLSNIKPLLSISRKLRVYILLLITSNLVFEYLTRNSNF